MYKLLSLFLVPGVLFPFASLARVCFLPEVLASASCLEDINFFSCTGYDRTTPCLSGYDQTVCTSGGSSYYNCVCRTDNITEGLGSKYKCSKDYDESCGCSSGDAVCNTSAYPYKGCESYSGSVPSADFCLSPADGTTKYYASCDCPDSVYPYTCKTEGLKKPSTTSNKCQSSGGEEKYSYCECADSYSTSPCEERNDGCTALMDKVDNGLSTCYLCTAAVCPKTTDVNLNTVWCPVPAAAITNCESLNYVYAPDGLCSNGRKGLKCIYNSDYIYCSD